MAQETREFRPLMEAIQDVLRQIEDTSNQSLQKSAQTLQKLYRDYADNCCMDARVVKKEPEKGSRP